MYDEDALFRAVLADPDDDAPRLVYADWLEERGDPRAEFIRVQCERASLPAADPRAAELRARERALLAAYRRRWNGPLHRALAAGPLRNQVGARRRMIRGWAYRRGFVEAVAMQLGAFLRHGDSIFALGPVQYLRLFERFVPAQATPPPTVRPWIRELASCPHLARLRTLDLHGLALDDGAAAELAASPYLQRLTTLDVSQNRLTGRGLRALRRSRQLRGLRALIPNRNLFGRLRSPQPWPGPGTLFRWLEPPRE